MCSLVILLVLCSGIYRLSHSSISGSTKTKQGTVLVDGTAPIEPTDDDFVCATIDWWPPDKCDYRTCNWGRASLLNLDLNNPILLNAMQGSDMCLIEKILNPTVLSSASETFSSLQSILKRSGTSAVAWVGTVRGAYNSGCNLATNAFVFSFWYLDQLGMAASYGTKTYRRQTLIGGNYSLLNTNTDVTNPDYYSALLWHRLMGNKVLSTSFSGTKKTHTYAHCSKKIRVITLLLNNLEKHTTVLVCVSTENTASSETLNMHPRIKFSTSPQESIPSENITREEYHLTAKHGHLESQNVFTNGKILNVDPSGVFPPLEPINKNVSEPITVAPFSVVFAVIPSIDVPACR